MRFRAPLLYEQYIGQYLTQEELSARTPAHQPPKPGSPGTPACPLSDLLLQSYEEQELQQRLLQQQEEEEACLEEEEEEEEDSDKEGEDQQQGSPSIWTPQSWACVSPQSMAPGWAPPAGVDIDPRALCALALPDLSGISAPSSSKAPSKPSPPGLCSCCSLCRECLPFATLQVSSPDPVLQPAEHRLSCAWCVLQSPLCSQCYPAQRVQLSELRSAPT